MLVVKLVILIAFFANIHLVTVFAHAELMQWTPKSFLAQNQEPVHRKRTEMQLDKFYRVLLQVYYNSNLIL
jgi:hypothetical protein